MAGTRMRYTDEFKREAVRLASEPGNAVSGVAKDLGIERGLIRSGRLSSPTARGSRRASGR